MELNDARYADVVVARLSGRLDQKTSDGVPQGLVALVEAETGPPCMTIDLSGIEYISSVGLRALMVAAKKCKHAEGKLVVAALQPVVLEVFQISKFDKIIPIFDSLRDALASFSEAAAIEPVAKSAFPSQSGNPA